MKRFSLTSSARSLSVLSAALSSVASGQLVFSTNSGLFERVNGQSVRLDSGSTPGLYAALSRDGRWVSYSKPDLVTANGSNGTNPSSDLVVFDRLTRTTRTIINNDTTQIGADFDPLSSQVSPSGQVIAYGVRIGPSFGTSQSATTALVVADFATGIALSEPTLVRNSQSGPTSDALSAEFRGISFLPNSDSFVTPVLTAIQLPGSAAVDAASAITRFDRGADGQWFPAATLSTPQAQATSFIGSVPTDASSNYQIYPAISPNGAGLAYFDVFRPSRWGGQASSCAVILANSDGSNPRVLTSFNAGFLPSGLAWTSDGTALVVSVSEQVFTGTGWIEITNTANSAIFNVSTSDGATEFVSELGAAFGPTLSTSSSTGGGVDLSQVRPSLRTNSSGGLTFQVAGLPANETFAIQSSSVGALSGFTTSQQATGSQLAAGVNLAKSGGKRFFRLAAVAQ